MLEVTRIENRVFASNTYVVFDADYNYCWLVDIGDTENVLKSLPTDVEVRGVLLTHSHFDHIYGINELHRAFPSCKVYTSEYGKTALYDDKKNFSRYHEQPIVYEGDDVVVLKDGDKVELFPGVSVEVYATQGHCPSCLTYVLDNKIFTGDAYIPGVKVVTKLPQGNRKLAAESVEKIMSLAKGRIIYPGHGEPFEIHETRDFYRNYFESMA